MKTAVLIGATGLVGNELLQLLLNENNFEKVLVFARRSTGYTNFKLTEHIINFDKPEEWSHLVKGDVLFSALGTTIKQAGSKENQYTIDYTYQFKFAEAAAKNAVPVYVLVSSAGADVKAKVFYSKMKGELERDVAQLNFRSVFFIRPSLLTGHRKENRIGEKIGFAVLNALNSVGVLRKYKPIEGKIVAQAMLNCSVKAETGIHTVELKEVFKSAGL